MQCENNLKLRDVYVMRKVKKIASLCLVLLLACTLPSVASDGISQMKSISLKVSNKSLKQAFNELEKTTDYLILMMDGIENDLKKTVNVNIEGKTINETLNILLEGTDLTYKVTKKQITIQKRQSVKTSQQHSSFNTTQKGAQQQKRKFAGSVKDEKGEPLVGATVFVPNTTYGASTNIDGNFLLEIPSEVKVSQLVASYVGYKPKTIKVSEDSNKPMRIILELDAFVAKDVVVTGLFNRKKEGFSGTSVRIDKEELKKAYTGNIFTTLGTLDASFKITEDLKNGSNPNELGEFTIRGRGSLSSSNTLPLFILDGFQISQDKFYDLDIDRIESITILKDASATILYGSKASNGVIVIESVQPKTGELMVSYNFRGTANVVDLSSYNLMNAKEKFEYEMLAGLYDLTDLSEIKTDILYEGALLGNLEMLRKIEQKKQKLLSGVDTDWLAQPVRDGFRQDHSLYAEGGNEAVRYGLNLSYSQNQGVMKGSQRDNFSIGNTLIYRVKDKVVIRNMLSYSYMKGTESPYGDFSEYVGFNPDERLYDENGNDVAFLSQSDGVRLIANPLYNAKLPNDNYQTMQEIRNNLSVDWNVISELRLRADVSVAKGSGKGRVYRSAFHTSYIIPEIGTGGVQLEQRPVEERGMLSLTDSENFRYDANITANYNKIFNLVHGMYLGVGGSISQQESSTYGFSATGFPNDRFREPQYALQYNVASKKPSGNDMLVRDMSVFGTFNYIFDERYFTDFSLNRTGSSSFGANERFGLFWSLGGGWNVHKEKFMPKEINQLKLKASYGVTGNQSFSASQARSTFRFETGRLFNTTIPAILSGYGNKDLKWETTGTLNLGLDFSAFKNRLGFNFSHYQRKTNNTIANIAVSPSLGFTGNGYTGNIGSVENLGYEFELVAVPVRTKELDISVRIQAHTNKNKVTSISNSLQNLNKSSLSREYGEPGRVYMEGNSLYDMYAVKSKGIDPGTGREIFVKADGSLTYEYDVDDKVVCGSRDDVVSGIISFNIAWKDFTLSAGFNYRLGADKYNMTLADKVEAADPKKNADKRVLENRWKQPGDHALFVDIRDVRAKEQGVYQSSRFIQRDNAFDCSYINLSYEVPKTFIRKFGLRTARLHFSTANPFEYRSMKQERGIAYPFQRSYTFGLNFSL